IRNGRSCLIGPLAILSASGNPRWGMGTRVIGGRRTYSRFSRGSSRPVLLRLAVSLVLVAGVMVAAPSPARAAPTWSVSPSPSPPGPPNGNLAAVACLSETNCYAVGGYFTTSGGKTLV